MVDPLYTDYRARLIAYMQQHPQLQANYGFATVAVGPQQELLQQGNTPRRVYILLSGLIKVTRTTVAGQPFTLGVFDRGELVGEAEVLLGTQHFCAVHTLTACTFYSIKPEVFLQLLAQEPDFNLLIHQSTTSMLLNTSHLASILSTNRLLYTLLVVLRELSRLNELRLHKSLLAEFLGTSQRNLNRLLAQLEQEKIIRLHQANISSIDLPLLAQRIRTYETTLQ